MPTTEQKEALASNVTFCCEIFKMVARDGSVLAVAQHTQNLTVGGTAYKAKPFEIEQMEAQLGLDPDTSRLTGVFDDDITEAGVRGGKWRGARIYTAVVVDYRNLSFGVVAERSGFAGRFTLNNGRFSVEFLSLSQLLSQELGELTSPVDRRRRLDELGIDIAAHTHATTVTGVTDRRVFTVGDVQADGYYQYGLALFTSGANSGLEMEIKNNVGGVLTLQLPMRSPIVNGDGVTLIRGYDGTRDAAKLLGSAVVEGLESEPDLPGLSAVLTYPS
jgi:uncharacterized phage protein (TIGR02218 family)